MKIAVDRNKLHLRFVFGTGFVIFVIAKLIKRKDPETAETVKAVGGQLKKLLKSYKRANGSFNLVEIEGKDKSRIVIRI